MPSVTFSYIEGDPNLGAGIVLDYPCAGGTVHIACYPLSAAETSAGMQARFGVLFDKAMEEHPWQR